MAVSCPKQFTWSKFYSYLSYTSIPLLLVSFLLFFFLIRQSYIRRFQVKLRQRKYQTSYTNDFLMSKEIKNITALHFLLNPHLPQTRRPPRAGRYCRWVGMQTWPPTRQGWRTVGQWCCTAGSSGNLSPMQWFGIWTKQRMLNSICK